MFKIISLHLSCYRWGLGREGRFLPEGFWILTLLWRNHVGTVHGRILHTEKGVKILQEKIVFSLLASWESKRAPEFLIRLSLHPSFMPQHTHWKECPPPCANENDVPNPFVDRTECAPLTLSLIWCQWVNLDKYGGVQESPEGTVALLYGSHYFYQYSLR